MQNLPEFRRTCRRYEEPARDMGNLPEINSIMRGTCQNLHFWPSKRYIKGPLYEKASLAAGK
jgi:hypothetical protein